MPIRTASRLLRYARRKAGLSQRDLARTAGVPQSTVARIEAATTSPRVDTLEHLLRATGQTLAIEPRPEVDRTIIRALLELTPLQRLELGPSSGRRFRSFERESRRRAGLPELGIPRSMDIDEVDLLLALREELDGDR